MSGDPARGRRLAVRLGEAAAVLGQAAAVVAVAYVLTSPPRPRGWRRHVEASRMTHDELERAVRELMDELGVRLRYHTYDSRRSPRGFPDWVIVGRDRMMFRELKSSEGRTSRAQLRWLAALKDCGQDAGVWRPEDLKSGRIRDELLALSGREC